MSYITFQPSDYFKTLLYTGTGSSNAVTGVGFRPDFVWIKGRDFTDNHNLYDIVRGVEKRIVSNNNGVQEDRPAGLTAFGSDGFTVNTANGENKSSAPIVSWNWRAGNAQGSSNTDGTINTTYTSVNTTAGFSISTYTGNATQGATVGHGLGAAPKMIIIKSTTNAEAWVVGHQHTNATNPWDYYLHLHETAARGQNNNRFGNVTPTASVFTLGNEDQVNSSSKSYVAYCFAEKKGFSKFGSYIGNGNANGPFIYCGFKPAFFLLKRVNSTASWVIVDNQRSNPLSNPQDRLLFPNTTAAEDGSGETYFFDFLADGVKIRTTSGSYGNASGDTYIYMAFAEQPLVSSNDIPATAR
mgnify:CR=1 FL=1